MQEILLMYHTEKPLLETVLEQFKVFSKIKRKYRDFL